MSNNSFKKGVKKMNNDKKSKKNDKKNSQDKKDN